MKLARAIVFVKDAARMTAFYRDGLGLAVHLCEGDWVELDGVALHAIPDAIAAGITIEDPPRAREDTPIKLVFAAHDLGAARAHLIAAGAQMGEIKPWGACDGVDPEGNVFQIVPGGSE
jgi:catechol 2,3-dioxygenase-like lactoylglutathione lyase family enzyme